MKVRPLILDASSSGELARVRKFAEENPIPNETLQSMVCGDHPPPGDYPEWTCEVPVGWRVVFTVEDQPMGRVRHLSISISARDEGLTPDLRGVALLAQVLGFSFGDDLEFTPRQRVVPDPTLGWVAPNVIELL